MMSTAVSNKLGKLLNVVALVLAIVFFMVDLALPHGLLYGIPYFLVIWLTYYSRVLQSVTIATVISALLIFLGWLYSPEVVSVEYSLINRLGVIAALCISGIFIRNAMSFQTRLEEENASTLALANQLAIQHDNSRAQSRALAGVMEDLNFEREQLRNNEELFRVTLEANPTAIIMTDERGCIRMVNREAERLFDISEQGVIGQALQDYLPEIQMTMADQQLQSTHDPEPDAWESHHQETFAQPRSGEPFPVQVNTSFVRARNSLVALVNVNDITAAKEHARKLQQARDVAEQATRARGEFLANMSHEIRTPMTAILGYVDIISDRTDDPDNLQALEIIRTNGRHLLQIINDILDLSKIDAGKMSVAKVMANISELVSEVRSLMDVRASENKKTLDFVFVNEIPEEIETDPLRLRQILLNLIGNAIKFTPHGGVVVSTQYDPESNMMQFDVADTGIGIAPEHLERLFQPFSQVDTSTTREYEGSGLGLAISRRLAQALGGDLSVVSELGKGSTFSLRISGGHVSTKRSRPEPIISAQVLSSKESVDAWVSGTILVIDDRRDIRFLAQHLIEKAGGKVLTATNGQEAVDLLLNGKLSAPAVEEIDLVLMDMQMPVMDGYEATRILRAAGFSKPIVALTANAMLEDREKCLQAGCSDFITKPIDSRKLITLLNTILSSASQK